MPDRCLLYGPSNAGPGCPRSTLSLILLLLCAWSETSMPIMYFSLSCLTHEMWSMIHEQCGINLLFTVLILQWPNEMITSQKSIEGQKDSNLWIVSHCTLHRSGFKFGPVFRQVTVSWLLWAKPSWSKHPKVDLHKSSVGNYINLKTKVQ